MTDEQALNLADHLEDLAAMLTQKAQRIRKTVQPVKENTTPITKYAAREDYITPRGTPFERYLHDRYGRKE